MKKLSVKLNYNRVDRDQFRTGGGVGNELVLPVQVLNKEGAILANGAVGLNEAAALDVPGGDGALFVKLIWPSGQSVTQQVGEEEATGSVEFNDESISQNEWSAWAVPRLNQSLSSEATERAAPGALKDVEFILRRFNGEGGGWASEREQLENFEYAGGTWQFEMALPKGSWLLQIKSLKHSGRFISLPSGPCRVLVTPNQSHDPRAEPLKVLVTSFRHGVETLLEYLSRDSLQAAESLATNNDMAVKAFESDDPYIAIAGGYYLLRMDYWREDAVLPQFKRLYDSFSGIADTALLYSTVLARRGLTSDEAEAEALSAFETAMSAGYPVYSEAMRLLQEMAGVLKFTKKETNEELLQEVRDLVSAQAWAGSSFSFYGEMPEQPMPQGGAQR